MVPGGGRMIADQGKEPRRLEVTIGVRPTDPRSKDPTALTVVMVNISSARGTGAPAQSDYPASITFGPGMAKQLETFDMSASNTTTGRKGGSGTVILTDSGMHAQVTLDLQPVPGVAVTGTATCTNVLRY